MTPLLNRLRNPHERALTSGRGHRVRVGSRSWSSCIPTVSLTVGLPVQETRSSVSGLSPFASLACGSNHFPSFLPVRAVRTPFSFYSHSALPMPLDVVLHLNCRGYILQLLLVQSAEIGGFHIWRTERSLTGSR